MIFCADIQSMKKLAFILLAAAGLCAHAQEASTNGLSVLLRDIRLEYEHDTFEENVGYHLYIRKKPQIESILLVETTKDPDGKEDNFAYRAPEYNAINGDEIRYLDGKILDSPSAKYSLADSTPEADAQFGQAFHIYIPSTMEYGYPWTRNGSITIGKGVFINIRAFSKKYCDYTGDFFDNPFMFDLQKPVYPPEAEPKPVLTDDYNSTAASAFEEIAADNDGVCTYSAGPESLVDDIIASINRIDPKKNADVVFAIDATGSMKDDIDKLREQLIPQLKESAKQFKRLRLGLLLYRDYGSDFSYKGIPVKYFDFTTDIAAFEKNLNAFTIKGTEGGDIPEAVYEALYGAVEFYSWKRGTQRKVILIGDAEPHPTPRGSKSYTKEVVQEKSAARDVIIDTIILPDDKAERGR